MRMQTKQLKLSYTTDGNTKWYCHLRKQFAISYKAKYILTIRISNPIPRYLLKKNKNLCSLKNVYLDVYSINLQLPKTRNNTNIF